MPWQVRTHCEHGWDEHDQELADAILAAAPLVGRAAWLLSYPPQLMVSVVSEDAANDLVEALTGLPHIGSPHVVRTEDAERETTRGPAVLVNPDPGPHKDVPLDVLRRAKGEPPHVRPPRGSRSVHVDSADEDGPEGDDDMPAGDDDFVPPSPPTQRPEDG